MNKNGVNTRENEYDSKHVIHSIFCGSPVTIRFLKAKNEEVETAVLSSLLDTFDERIRLNNC